MTHTSQRIQVIDAIRGIALFGILVFNIQTYALFAFLEPSQVYQLQLDQPQSYAPLQFVFHVLVNAQFYTIYSFLFGLGFYMLTQKNEQLGLNSTKIFKSRLWILLLLGLIHGLIFWFGDILHKYALFGFTLLYFNKKSTKTLYQWMAGIMLFSAVLRTVIIFLTPPNTDSQEISPVIMQVLNTWQHGSFAAVVGMQKLGVAMLWFMGLKNGLSGIAHYLVMFILGLIAGKSNFFLRIPALKQKMLKMAFFVFPLALLLKVFANLNILGIQVLEGLPEPWQESIISLANFIAVPFLAVCYLIFLSVFLFENTSIIFKWISNAGKIGLTNYLMQTVLCMILFYGYALGFSGKLTLLETFFWVIPIYCFQLLFSTIWLRYYKTGPVENLWRKLSSALVSKTPLIMTC